LFFCALRRRIDRGRGIGSLALAWALALFYLTHLFIFAADEMVCQSSDTGPVGQVEVVEVRHIIQSISKIRRSPSVHHIGKMRLPVVVFFVVVLKSTYNGAHVHGYTTSQQQPPLSASSTFSPRLKYLTARGACNTATAAAASSSSSSSSSSPSDPCTSSSNRGRRNRSMLPDPIVHHVDPPKAGGRNRKRSRQQRNGRQGRAAGGVRLEANTREKSIAKGRDPIISLNMNLDYLGKSGQRGAASRAEELLLRIEALHAEGYYEITPDTVSYNSVMNAYARHASATNRQSAEDARRLLGRMEEMTLDDIARGGRGALVRPNAISFNTLILALGNSGQPEAAEELLLEMEDSCLAAGNELRRNGGPDGGGYINKDKGSVSCMPNTITYNSCILAWAKQGNAQRAESLLRRMMELSLERNDQDELKADCISFNTCLYAYAINDEADAAERAEDLLRHMETLYLSGNEDVRPDSISYTSVISAWSSSRQPQAADRALQLLEEMEELYEAGEEYVRPNTHSYTAVINALARSGSAGSAQKSRYLLDTMHDRYRAGRKDCKPDVACYTSVIDAYARSRSDDAGDNAVELINEMIEGVEAGDEELKPNTRTYCSVIAALGRSKTYGAAESAEKLLEDMERMYAFGNREVRPTTAVFNAVIDAYAQSSYKRKAERAHQLLLRMLEESSEGNADVRPDVISYNSVLKTCANAYGNAAIKKRAFLIALDTFKRLSKSKAERNRRTSVTYSLFFKAIRKLVESGSERDAIARKMFAFCIADGVLNRQVMSQIQSTCSESVVADLLSSNGASSTTTMSSSTGMGGSVPSIDVALLPSAWTCNAGR